MAVQTIKNNFEETVLQAEGPVVVDFWAPWCGYCRRLYPAVERMSEEYNEKVKMAKLDIDEEPELAEKYNIDTIPTLLLFRDGGLVDSVVNPGSQDEIEDWLRENGAL
ncbi:thioredoxin [[Clostridium] symbiosum]|jgi:thioredoxin 1|uniref:thioredoxin n=1 Tax=Clostridium symbiosum TaxID=1512 RepID=UPI00189C775E|nr:thioredoxin [[Clostridium] symbiosum]